MASFLERALDATSNGVVITAPNEPDNPIVYANPAFERITDYPPEEVLGRNCRFLQGEDVSQPELEEVRAATREGRECRVVLKNYRRDGTPFWNELYVSPIYDGAGRLTNFIGVQNDVTGRKRAEEERDSLLERERQAREWAEKATRRMLVLQEASSVLSASLDYETTLARITEIFVPNLADWCLVDVVDEDGAVSRTAQAHVDPEKELLLREVESESSNVVSAPEVAAAISSGRSSLGQNAGETFLREPPQPGDLPDAPENGGREGRLNEILQKARSYMVVPLVARGRRLGAVTLVSSVPGRRYEREDLSLAEELANRCGLALEGARLYREQSYVARTLQRGLLLKDLPEITGVEVGLEYLAAGEESEVGGDFYDLIDTHYDGWLCLLGDVSGKGARAATSTALILYALRAVAFRGDKPSMILSALNEAMLRQDSGNQFCTAVCARLEPEECEGRGVKLTLARGGHPPPLLLGGDGSMRELAEPGRAIGIFENLELEDLTVRLEPGDTLVLYTDGVTEARASDGDFFGEDRLRELVRGTAGLDAASVAGRIKDTVLEHQGVGPSDDVAILVLRVSEA